MDINAPVGNIYLNGLLPTVSYFVPPPPVVYKLHGAALSSFGILPLRADGSNIAISGHLDLPSRRNKTEQLWGDQNGVEPYVAESEIMFNGRDITFNGIVKGSSRGNVDIKMLDFYDLIDSVGPNELMEFITPWGTFNVLVNGEIETEYYRNGYCKLTIPFREPHPDLSGGTIPENGDPSDITGIDGIDFDSLGFSVVDLNGLGVKTTGLSGIFNRSAPQAPNAIGYYQEPFQVTKTGPKSFDLNALIEAENYAGLVATIKDLYALLMAPGTRVIYLKGDRLRIVYCRDGFEVTRIHSKGRAMIQIHFVIGEEFGDVDYKVLGTVADDYVTTTTGQKILLKL